MGADIYIILCNKGKDHDRKPDLEYIQAILHHFDGANVLSRSWAVLPSIILLKDFIVLPSLLFSFPTS